VTVRELLAQARRIALAAQGFGHGRPAKVASAALPARSLTRRR
jgi:uncharacterized protein YcaQ